jgi:hypothetical protein
MIQNLGKEIEEQLQPVQVLDDAERAEMEFVHAFWKVSAKPSFVILDREMNMRQPLDQLPDTLIGKEGSQFCFIIAFDDERLVKVRVADHHILHSKEFAKFAEEACSVDREAKSILVDIRGPQTGISRGSLSVCRKNIEGDRPLSVIGLNFVAFPESTIDIFSLNFVGEFLPDFLSAGPEYIQLEFRWRVSARFPFGWARRYFVKVPS